MSADAHDSHRRQLPRLLGGMRARSTAAAVLVVAVALVAGSATFVWQLQRALVSTVQQAATSRAEQVVAQVRVDGVGGLAGEGLGGGLTAATRESQILQVVDAADRVVFTSAERARQHPLSEVRPADGQVRQVPAGRVPLLDDDPYVVVVAGVASGGELYRVVVGTAITAQRESVRTALSLLVVAMPLLLLLVGVATWLLVGRALAPVERIRAQVAQMGGSSQRHDIPVPPTGDEIARLAVTMNEMLARLAEGRRVQRRFVADASHELRSPLATLAASVDVASADPSGRSWRELSPLLADEVARMGRLVQDLLLLARVDEHSMALRLRDVDLDDLVDEQARRSRAHPALTVVSEVRPVRVVGDPERLGQVLTNLTDNAILHARSSVRLSLQEEDDGGALVVVEDDGPGVPVADRERVFERFVRLDDSRERSRGGSGLGLAIVREVVHAHGGSVRLLEATGGGCRVELRLPGEPSAAVGGDAVAHPPGRLDGLPAER